MRQFSAIVALLVPLAVIASHANGDSPFPSHVQTQQHNLPSGDLEHARPAHPLQHVNESIFLSSGGPVSPAETNVTMANTIPPGNYAASFPTNKDLTEMALHYGLPLSEEEEEDAGEEEEDGDEEEGKEGEEEEGEQGEEEDEGGWDRMWDAPQLG